MKILVLGLNYAPEKVGIAVYTTGMAEALACQGHEVQVIAGQPYYPAWAVPKGYSRFWYGREIDNGIDVTRAPHYVPKNPTGIRRLAHHMSFAATSLFPMLTRSLRWKPDLVVTIAPSLIGAPVAKLAAIVCGAASWLHIQDFEVEAAFATRLLSESGRIGSLAKAFEKVVLKSFDKVSTISPQMCEKLREKGIPASKIFEFRNWADIDQIRPLDHPSPYRTEWNIGTSHVALYSGNIANKQGIEIVVEAARLLLHRKDITFVICGEGPNRSQLEILASGLENIRFHDLQPKERLNELVGLATIHLLPQVAGAADLVLPSKLTNMLASGRPVVATATINSGLFQEIEGCGIATQPGNASEFANAIVMLASDPDLHSRLSAAARSRAEKMWDRRAITSNFGREVLVMRQQHELSESHSL